MAYNGDRDLCDRRRHSYAGFIADAQIVPIGVLKVGVCEFVLLSRAGFTQADGCSQVTEAEAMEAHDDDTLLTPSEVAAMFRVNPKTVTRWARAGKISAIRTLGGHRRFRASEIRHFLDNVEESDRI